ncbi:MAG: decaprenyl-phosphate phosphoribosyltransferase [Streptosporangiaceae bacterium]
MTSPTRTPTGRPAVPAARRRVTVLGAAAGFALAAVQAARPRQWPKNLLVFAAPLAGGSLGRDDGFGYALVAFAAFTAAASAVYLINDVMDVDRDRAHPVKRRRPVAAGRLPQSSALVLAGTGLAAAVLASLAIREPLLAAVICSYVALSLVYSAGLKHLPWIELAFVASGFVFRALGGAVATQVPPSGWFLAVCSLGALMVATGKRYTELSMLGRRAVAHRPVMRWYSASLLRAVQRAAIAALLACYLAWALSEHTPWRLDWHLASLLPLAAALIRFDWLTARAGGRPVEDLICRDRWMVGCEVAWLALFLAGLA